MLPWSVVYITGMVGTYHTIPLYHTNHWYGTVRFDEKGSPLVRHVRG